MRMSLSLAVASVALASPAGAVTVVVPDDQPTIQAGLDATAAGDTVRVRCGTYLEHDLLLASGQTLLGETGDPACVIVDAQGLGTVLRLLDGRVRGMTFQGGSAVDDGGGIFCFSGSPEVYDCVVRDNRGDSGGGVYVRLGASPRFERCVIRANAADGPSGRGGGALVSAGAAPLFLECTFRGNVASDRGGGVHVLTASPELRGCRFSENRAVFGGGLSIGRGSTMDVVGCVLSGNEADLGGGVYYPTDASQLSTVRFLRTTFGRNVAREGGAFFTERTTAPGSRSRVDFTGCSFLENVAERGGGIFLQYVSSRLENCLFASNEATVGDGGGLLAAVCTPHFFDCIFSGNTAAEAGAGAYCFSSSATFSTCIFHENRADGGGSGIHLESSHSVQVSRSVLAFGRAGPPVGCAASAGPAMDCCILFGNAGGDWVGCIAGRENVNGNSSADPLFCRPGDRNFSVSPDSPCLAANNTCGVEIGVTGIGCSGSRVLGLDPVSWGRLKARYGTTPP
jgi:hypothetical protein